MRMKRVGALAVSLVLATGLAACGGDDGDGDDALSPDTTEASGGEETTTTEGSTDETVGDLPEGVFGGCTELLEAFGNFAGAFTGTGDGELDFGLFAESMAAAGDEFGGDIGDDFDVMAAAYADADDAFGGEPVDLSNPEAFSSPEFQSASEAFGDPAFTDASTNVSNFLASGCEG